MGSVHAIRHGKLETSRGIVPLLCGRNGISRPNVVCCPSHWDGHFSATGEASRRIASHKLQWRRLKARLGCGLGLWTQTIRPPSTMIHIEGRSDLDIGSSHPRCVLGVWWQIKPIQRGVPKVVSAWRQDRHGSWIAPRILARIQSVRRIGNGCFCRKQKWIYKSWKAIDLNHGCQPCASITSLRAIKVLPAHCASHPEVAASAIWWISDQTMTCNRSDTEEACQQRFRHWSSNTILHMG